MKNLNPFLMLAFLLAVLSFKPASAGKTGIRFNDNVTEKKFEDLLEKARKENKLVFVDVYADWCGWCKKLDKDIYSQNEVSSYFNENFINIKVDAESEFGESFTEEYGVTAYPTLLFFSPDGDKIKVVEGYVEAAELVNAGTLAQEMSAQKSEVENKINSGNATDEDLAKYAVMLKNAGDEDLAKEYATQVFANISFAELKKEAFFELAKNFAVQLTDPDMNYIIDRFEVFKQLMGEEAMSDYLNNILVDNFFKAVEDYDEQLAADAITLYWEHAAESDEQRQIGEADYMLTYYEKTEEFDRYGEKAVELIGNIHPEELSNEYLNLLYSAVYTIDINNISDEDILESAIDWASTLYDKEKDFANTYFYASLSSKTGRSAQAERLAKEALKISESDTQTDLVQSLLDSIQDSN